MIGRFHTLSPHFPPGEYENTFTNARGEVRTIYWRTAPAKDAAGNVVSIVSGGLDITERRKRELELERERDATTTALEATATAERPRPSPPRPAAAHRVRSSPSSAVPTVACARSPGPPFRSPT